MKKKFTYLSRNMFFLSDIQQQKTDGSTTVISQGDWLMQATMAALAAKPFSLGEFSRI